jgi:hypothetical protein
MVTEEVGPLCTFGCGKPAVVKGRDSYGKEFHSCNRCYKVDRAFPRIVSTNISEFARKEDDETS